VYRNSLVFAGPYFFDFNGADLFQGVGASDELTEDRANTPRAGQPARVKVKRAPKTGPARLNRH
jgi:hypothetical protein